MKKILAIFITATCIIISAIPANAETWSFIGPEDKNSNGSVFGDEPFASTLSIASDGLLGVYSGNYLTPFVPVQMDQFVISLLDVSSENRGFESDEVPLISRFQLNTGIKSESYLADRQPTFAQPKPCSPLSR